MLVREVILQSCKHQLRMHSSNIWSTMNINQNESVVGELSFESNSMTKVNITSETLLFFKIPTIFLVIIINSTSVVLFQSLETNFVYKMIIYDSINNMLYAISLFLAATSSIHSHFHLSVVLELPSVMAFQHSTDWFHS